MLQPPLFLLLLKVEIGNMNDFKIFIVEDDPFYGRLLKHHLSLNPEYHLTLFNDGKSCIKEMHLKPDVVCLDYGLPDIDGSKMFSKLRTIDPTLNIVIISNQEDISIAVNLLKLGARDYIVKDDNTKDLLWRSIINIRENAQLKDQVESLKDQLEEKHSFSSIIGSSKSMQKVYSILNKAIKSNINISITGETGTGKEVVAKAIHYNSARSKEPFVAVNMAAIPENLLESELFGHEKGAFTGATSRKIGKFESAKNGTLFLDEIAEMDLSLQSKILRSLQEREFTRVGGTNVIPFKSRLITATHRDLQVQVKEGEFREDLYYRIMGLPIELPPLKDRDEDIIILAEYFIERYVKDNKLNDIKLNKSAKEKLLKYSFPGNVRELKAIIDLACVMIDGNGINASDIIFSGLTTNDEFTYGEQTLKEYNIQIVSHYLEKYNNNVLLVAKKLDIGKSKIYNMIKNGELKNK